ncbi:MAG: TadE/TadG family type IV pilus assembly protein [Motiliproteus sp.]
MLRDSNQLTSTGKQRGMAVVEMTLVLPLLLLLFWGVSEVGRMLYLYNTLTQVQRDGARYLSSKAFFGQGEGAIILIDETSGENGDLTKNLIVYGNTLGTGTPLLKGFSTADVTLSIANPTHIQVDVVYTFTPLWGGTIPTFGYGTDIDVSFPLSSSLIMRAL